MDQNGHNTALAEKSTGLVTCITSEGVRLRADILRLSRHKAVFEIHAPDCALQVSEQLKDFKLKRNDQVVYSGKAVVSSLVYTGTTVVCEATLDETGFDHSAITALKDRKQARAAFDEFLREWGRNYKIGADFKVMLADMQTFLTDLRLWLEQVEMGLRALPENEREATERRVAESLAESVTPALCVLFEKFELAARRVKEDGIAAHAAYCRRFLHPHLMCSPFMHRIFTKPLGYAGDYEMVSMILRDPYEGESLFARLLNAFILSQAPALAHRNRVTFLTQTLVRETNRMHQQGRTARIFNIGCGPVGEIQAFLREYPLSNHAHFTLLDSNEETLDYTQRTIETLARKHSRRTGLKIVKKSVHQMLRQSGRPQAGEQFDLIYCAGLFDYLNDQVCKVLMDVFYKSLAPGGLLVATNVDAGHPIRNIMEFIYEWHLIYRHGHEFAKLAPADANPDDVAVTAEPTSSNIFIEVRKPL